MKSIVDIKSVSPADDEVKEMIRRLDHFHILLYGSVSCELDSPETLLNSKAFMLGSFHEGLLVGIGAVKLFDEYAEIKRMFVMDSYRGFGIAKKILLGLETYAREQNRNTVKLETGLKQTSAIRLYEQCGYLPIPPFGNYKPTSVNLYFEKKIV